MEKGRIVRGSGAQGYRGKQGLDYFAGISSESADSKAICMHLLVTPPGPEAKPHYHETAIFMLEDASEFRHGPKLEHLDRVEASDFVYIPAGVPHQPYNPTDKGADSADDPNEQKSVVLLPETALA